MKISTRKNVVLLATTAMAIALPLCAPQSAMAQSADTAQLEARLKQLEASMDALKAELAKAKSTPAPAAAAPAAAPAEGFRVGNTTVKVGGFIKTVGTFSNFSAGEVAANALGRDFYLPGQIPTGTGRGSRVFDASAKQTRLWTNLTTDVAGHTVKGYIEADFQTTAGAGSERTTNGYNMAVRRAYVQLDGLTIGQDWTTFQYTGALPESTDFVGVTEGTVFARQPLIRYTKKISPITTFNIALENSETASAVSGSPTLTENDDDRLPDLAARLQFNTKVGEFSVAGLVRELAVNNGVVTAKDTGTGISVAGKIPFGEKKTNDVRFMVTAGNGIGRYVGLNMVPDAIYANNSLFKVNNFAATGSVRFMINPMTRMNLMGSYQSADYPAGFVTGAFNTYTKKSQSIAANIFYSPVKGIDLGVEYRLGKRELVNGLDGSLNRIEFAAKYSF